MLLLVCSGIARADGGKSLIVGSVYRIGKNYIEVEVKAKEIVAVKTDASTTYFDSSANKPARSQDLAAGDQVAIKVVARNGENVAEQIRFVPSNGARKRSQLESRNEAVGSRARFERVLTRRN